MSILMDEESSFSTYLQSAYQMNLFGLQAILHCDSITFFFSVHGLHFEYTNKKWFFIPLHCLVFVPESHSQRPVNPIPATAYLNALASVGFTVRCVCDSGTTSELIVATTITEVEVLIHTTL
jgi:hypothetical protein